MSGKRLTVFFLIISIAALIAACSSQTNNLNDATRQSQPQGQQNTAPPTAADLSTADPFQAQATSAVSVELTWVPVVGTESYTVELSYGGEYFPVAILSADQTSFEDFPVPDNTELAYRLLALSGTDVLEEHTLSLTTPVLQPNPIVLEISEFMPVSPLANMQIPTLDPNNPTYDPSAYVIPGLNMETGEFDIDALMGEPVATTADIGPEGGSLSVTDPNNVTYTLYILPGALDEETTITMTPIESIDGLPLERFLGAVRLDPNGLMFNIPAFLTYTFPEEMVLSDELVTMNFGYDGDNNEFYFVPHFLGDPASLGDAHSAGKLASPVFRLSQDGELNGVAMQQLGSKGVGQGSSSSVENTIKNNAPTKTNAQKSNQAAGDQLGDKTNPLESKPDDDLAPLIPEDFNKRAHQVEAQVNAASTARELAAAIREFEGFITLYSMYGTNTETVNHIWDMVVGKTWKVFDKNKTICLTEDSFVAQAIGRHLSSPAGNFWRTFAQKFKDKYGDKLIKDMAKLIKECKFQLHLDSDVTTKLNEGGKLIKSQAKVNTTVTLKIDLDILGEPVFTGKGKLTYKSAPTVTSDLCKPPTTKLNINSLPKSTIEILSIRPQWDAKGELKDLWLDIYSISGKQGKVSMSCKDPWGDPVKGSGSTLGGQSGDIWGGLFVTAHFPGEQLIRDWKINKAVGPSITSSGILADRIYQKLNQGVKLGGQVDETTTFQIEKLAGKP